MRNDIKINNFINTIADENRDIVSTYLAGTTYENRVINVLVFKTSTTSKSIWIGKINRSKFSMILHKIKHIFFFKLTRLWHSCGKLST